jgi:hypothetical protein
MNDEERARYLELTSSVEWEVGLKNYDAPGLPDDPDLKHSEAEAVMEELKSRYDELEPCSSRRTKQRLLGLLSNSPNE